MEEIITENKPILDYENNKYWYCVKTQNKKEEEVKEALDQRRFSMGIDDQLFRTFIPYETDEKDRKKLIFPGYVFVEMIMTNNAWYVVRNTKYVHGFIGSHGHGSKPIPVYDSEILNLLKKSGHEEFTSKLTLGQKVKVIGGPFKGNEAIIKVIVNDVARLDIEMFEGKTTLEVEVNLENLEEITSE